jgi:hypothetical protein
VSRLLRWSLVVASSSVVAVGAVALIGVAWNQRAEDICREEAPGTAGGYSVAWEWDELAYVCDYRSPAEPRKRVGITDAFHSGGSRRHRPNR